MTSIYNSGLDSIETVAFQVEEEQYDLAAAAVATALIEGLATKGVSKGVPDGPSNGVALGIRDFGLREFAEKNGYSHFLDVENWKSQVHEAVNYSDERLHVMLDGFDGDSASDKFRLAYENGIGDNWYATEWEMGSIGRSLRVGNRDWSSISFYLDGSMVDFEMPDLKTPGK